MAKRKPSQQDPRLGDTVPNVQSRSAEEAQLKGPSQQAHRLGDTVLFHDPRDGKIYPAIICHVDLAGTLDLHVLRPTDYNVPNAPGDFGHYGPLP